MAAPLRTNGFHAIAIHGDKVQVERERSVHLFKTGVTPILVATDVAARGLDIFSVAHVVNFYLPTKIDIYVHRIGRTGRAGRLGTATVFFTENNVPLAKALVELMQEAKQDVTDWLTEVAEKSSSYGGTYDQVDGQAGGEFGGFYYRCDNNSSSWDDAGGTFKLITAAAPLVTHGIMQQFKLMGKQAANLVAMITAAAPILTYGTLQVI